MTEPHFTFIDLFAGIGGIRLALESAGGTCVLTSEWDPFARRTYEATFGKENHFYGDIRGIEASAVPDHDLLAGGFPCQPFSLAGVSKKNSLGRAHGFDDPTQGTLFFEVLRILEARRPRALLLENVKHLRRHDKGRTFEVIARALESRGYAFTTRVVDSARVVPQHRERIFIMGLDGDRYGIPPGEHDFGEIWEDVDTRLLAAADEQRHRYNLAPTDPWPRVGPLLEPKVPDKYTLTSNLWRYLQNYRKKHEERGNGFGYSMVNHNTSVTRTLSARYYKDGSECLVSQGADMAPRRLTPLECARLQGFPESFCKLFDRAHVAPVTDTQAYKQFGNSVSVPVVSAVAQSLVRAMHGDFKLGRRRRQRRAVQLELSV